MERNKKCFANCHLTPAEFGLWEVLRSVSHKFKSRLLFDGRTIASYFGNTGKNVIYRLVDQLVDKGWLICTKKSERGSDGCMTPTEYRVLSHEEWTSKHGTKKCSPVPESGQDQSRNRDRHQSRNIPATSPEIGTYTENTSTEEEHILSTNHAERSAEISEEMNSSQSLDEFLQIGQSPAAGSASTFVPPHAAPSAPIVRKRPAWVQESMDRDRGVCAGCEPRR